MYTFFFIYVSVLDVLHVLVKYTPGMVNSVTTSGQMAGSTPLHLACIFDNLEAVRLLLNSGADVNANEALYNWTEGNTPLHFAAFAAADAKSNRTDKIFDLLIRRGAKVNALDEKSKFFLFFFSLSFDVVISYFFFVFLNTKNKYK